ncbi:hypothetical protein GCM10029964_013220 [Kibdelosporangium lantanae]
MSPAEVIQAVTAGVSRLATANLTREEYEAELDHLAGLYAENTDVRHPFAPLGDTPLRTRAELRAHFAQVRGPGIDRFEPVGQVYETTDPEVVVYEFSYVGEAFGRTFDLPCVFVTRVRDGVIVESRDYGDHVARARAFGQLKELASALVDQSV